MSRGSAGLFGLQLIDPSLFEVSEAHYLIFFFTLYRLIVERNVTFASLITEKLTRKLKLTGSLGLRDMNSAGSSLIPRPSVHKHGLPSPECKKKVSFSLGKASAYQSLSKRRYDVCLQT